jgi:diguanylate cyclase (GGDEF)-like protein
VVVGCVGALDRQSSRLAELSRTDPLTGLANRRAFDDDLDREVARARREGVRLSLAFLDVDRFKEVNDKYGHDAGDALLHHVAGVLRREARHGMDFAYRLGGDEFGVLMAGTDSARAVETVGRIREAAVTGPGGLESFGADVSVGVVELGPAESLAEFYRRADGAMYAMKRRTRAS